MKIIRCILHGIITMMVLVILSSTSKAQNNPKLSDAEVASVAVTANQIDINYAEIAKKNLKMPKFSNLPKQWPVITRQ